MTTSPRILIVEDSDDDADLLLRELKRGGIEADYRREDCAEGVRQAFADGAWDLVLSDFGLPRNEFHEILAAAREADPDVPFIVVSGSIGEENAIALMRKGVADFVFKGHLSRLIPAIHRELAAATAQNARREADQRCRDIIEVSGDWIWETDTNHRVTFFSAKRDGIEWASAESPLGKTCWEIAGVDPKGDEHWLAHLADLDNHRPFRNFLFSFVTPDGSRHHVSESGLPVFDRQGAFRGYRGAATDQTPVVEAFWRAEEAEAQLRDALESISEGLLIFDAEDRIVLTNNAFRKLYPEIAHLAVPGVTHEELLRSSLDFNVYPEAVGREAAWLGDRLQAHRDPGGSVIERLAHGRWVLITSRPMSNGGTASLNVDLTALKEAEAERDRLTVREPITGLPNETHFNSCVSEALDRREWSGGGLAVASLQLRSLAGIRESLGRKAGIAAKQELARRIKAATRGSELLAHAGNGQFLLLLGIESEAHTIDLLNTILARLADHFEIDGSAVPLKVAVGIALAPGDGASAEELVRNAGTAMNHAMSEPSQPYKFYSAHMTTEALRRWKLEGDLRRAIDNDEFFLVYQPQVASKTYELTGVEALVRWRHPERGVVMPGEFIALAEQNGLIGLIGEKVLRLACAQCRTWCDSGLKPPPIAVNLSAVQLADPKLERTVFSILEAYRLQPDAIRLELTESAILRDVEMATRTMQNLSAQGICFALDDFGMEYSSLSHLSHLPFDMLKIDRAFLRKMCEDRGHAALFQAMVSMSHSLGMTAVAEGVESAGQLSFVQAYGCDIVQGYLFARPLAAIDFAAILKTGRLLPSADPKDAPTPHLQSSAA